MLGDFNGHLGVIGKQSINLTGRKVLELIDNFNLSLLNLDNKCKGEITWRRDNWSSAIDFAMCNELAYKDFYNMFIDEEREELDLSDHNLIVLNLECNTKYMRKIYRNIIIIYNKKSEKDILEYVREVESKLDMDKLSIEDMNEVIRNAKDKCLKVEYRRKVREDGVKEPKWMNRDIKKSIAKRRVINKKRRILRKEIDYLRNM